MEDFYKDIAEDVEARFDASGYIPDRPFSIGENKKVIGLMKDELGGKPAGSFKIKMQMYKFLLVLTLFRSFS